MGFEKGRLCGDFETIYSPGCSPLWRLSPGIGRSKRRERWAPCADSRCPVPSFVLPAKRLVPNAASSVVQALLPRDAEGTDAKGLFPIRFELRRCGTRGSRRRERHWSTLLAGRVGHLLVMCVMDGRISHRRAWIREYFERDNPVLAENFSASHAGGTKHRIEI